MAGKLIEKLERIKNKVRDEKEKEKIDETISKLEYELAFQRSLKYLIEKFGKE